MTDQTSTVYLANGSVFTPMSRMDLNMHERLPAANFTVIKHPITGALMLQRIEPFSLPPKMYGNINKRAERILTTFNARTQATGALFAGEKGSGKTQLARLISVRAAEQGIPTLLVNEPYAGEDFFKLVASIQQPMVVLFDEFEKVYDHDDQRKVLTLLDGMFPTQKLFVLTSNDKWLINEHMRNRPGRIFYMIDFRGLEEEFIRDYCNDVLQAKEHIDQIVRVSKMFNEFNFDMLKALVEEMNRYGDTPEQALELLNARPNSDDSGEYGVTVAIGGVEVEANRVYPRVVSGSPMSESEIGVRVGEVGESNDDDDEYGLVQVSSASSSKRRPRRPRGAAMEKGGYFVIRQHHLRKFDHQSGAFEYYVPERDAVVTFRRQRVAEANYISLL